MSRRAEILELLAGKKTSSQPAFSGLIHVTAEGLQKEELVFHEVHKDARKLAKASASTFKLSGWPSAVAPLDMHVEAETLGAKIDFRENGKFMFPQVATALFASTERLNSEYFGSTDFVKKGRIPLVCEAIQRLKQDIGPEAVIGGMIPGPYTLLLFLVEPGGLFTEMKREPRLVTDALLQLASFLAEVGVAYRKAGADFITIHDMGGSPGFIGPARYEQFAYPAEKLLIAELPAPRVLSVCGNTNRSMHLLAQTGADAISVDQLNDLGESRKVLTDTLLFGNIDPAATLGWGDEAEIARVVRGAKEAGVDAVWPGCDLALQTSIENLKAFIKAS
ncbi:MAG TPA: uroporphyrinogen decarboxylase family protein [Anaerolineales bacterium]|nr:uroporphyrinogen decarboxylase family protein [Anaerolineales bacterium]